MLTFDLLKNHAGLLLCGDYLSLRALHEIIHVVNAKSPLVKDRDGVLMGLAYEVRHAYQGQRRTLAPPEHYPEIGPRFGVETLWPALLVQSRMLREGLAFMPSTRAQQSIVYALESLIEEGLVADFKAIAPELQDRWEHVRTSNPWPEEKIRGRTCLYSAWTKTQRRQGLAGLLASLDPMYPMIYTAWTRGGVKHLLSPEQLDEWDDAELEDPRW